MRDHAPKPHVPPTVSLLYPDAIGELTLRGLGVVQSQPAAITRVGAGLREKPNNILGRDKEVHGGHQTQHLHRSPPTRDDPTCGARSLTPSHLLSHRRVLGLLRLCAFPASRTIFAARNRPPPTRPCRPVRPVPALRGGRRASPRRARRAAPCPTPCCSSSACPCRVVVRPHLRPQSVNSNGAGGSGSSSSAFSPATAVAVAVSRSSSSSGVVSLSTMMPERRPA